MAISELITVNFEQAIHTKKYVIIATTTVYVISIGTHLSF